MAGSPPPGLKVRQRTPVSARARQAELPPQLQTYVETGERLVAKPFRGITAETGVSTGPVTDAAQAFLASLNDGQRLRQHHARFDHAHPGHRH